MGILSFNSDIVECKVDYEKLQSLVDNCFNSDIVECKGDPQLLTGNIGEGFNSDIVECKAQTRTQEVIAELTF